MIYLRQFLSIFLVIVCFNSHHAFAATGGANVSFTVDYDENSIGDLFSKASNISKEEDSRLSASQDSLKHNNEALFRSIKSGNETAVKSLLSEDPSLANTCNRQGKTPLMVAAELGRINIVVLLLAFEADLDKIDKTGRNALDYARYYCFGTSDFTMLQVMEKATQRFVSKKGKNKTKIEECRVLDKKYE